MPCVYRLSFVYESCIAIQVWGRCLDCLKITIGDVFKVMRRASKASEYEVPRLMSR